MKAGRYGLVAIGAAAASKGVIGFITRHNAKRIRHPIAKNTCHRTAPSSLLIAGSNEKGRKTSNATIETKCHSRTPKEFVEEVVSFLDDSDIPWRHFPQSEMRNALEHYSRHGQQNITITSIISDHRVEEIMTLMKDRTILAVGQGTSDISTHFQPYSFILHLCPTKTYQEHHINASAVASYAWLNAHLTNAFFHYHPNNKYQVSNNEEKDKPRTVVVHLHQDVWNRSPRIVRSRLRAKCGIFERRIYARQTVARRIGKSHYIPFLESNHLWAATSAKYGYGLFAKRSKCRPDDEPLLVAAATFTHGRRVRRGSRDFRSYRLLRFCTTLDTTVVGGLSKLVSSFVRDMRGGNNASDDPMDLITTIDRDFGCNTWPKFELVGEAMDPIPMFVGDVDGMRRHAVGAGVTPLDHQTGQDNTTLMFKSELLRLGLPESLLDQLQQTHLRATNDLDWPWKLASRHGFHPVFDAGVERLMLVIDDGVTKMSPSELWETCIPRYVTKHYSPNAGVENMLGCIRGARDIYNQL